MKSIEGEQSQLDKTLDQLEGQVVVASKVTRSRTACLVLLCLCRAVLCFGVLCCIVSFCFGS